jgi:hypothetical protein
MATIATAHRAGSIGQASAVRSVAIECGEALDFELTYHELVRFLPSSTVEEFLEHLESVADVSDITEQLKKYK